MKILIVLLLAVLLLIAGCAMADRALNPYRADGSTPTMDLITNIPTLIGNPANVGAWGEILKAAGYVILGAAGKTGADRVRKMKKKTPKKDEAAEVA